MSFLRSLSATLASAASVFSLVTASCSTGAVGVDDCRDIESARCRAGAACGLIHDVAACERYYRDHCLHGLATAAPSRARVAECVQVIEAAGRCAADGADGADTSLASCQPAVTASRPGLGRACDVVEYPERSNECSFLADVPEPTGGGGEGSGGDASDATSGDAGASDGTSGGATAD